MDLRKLKTLIDLVSESGISELEVSEGEDKVKIVNTRGQEEHSMFKLPQLPALFQYPLLSNKKSFLVRL